MTLGLVACWHSAPPPSFLSLQALRLTDIRFPSKRSWKLHALTMKVRWYAACTSSENGKLGKGRPLHRRHIKSWRQCGLDSLERPVSPSTEQMQSATWKSMIRSSIRLRTRCLPGPKSKTAESADCCIPGKGVIHCLLLDHQPTSQQFSEDELTCLAVALPRTLSNYLIADVGRTRVDRRPNTLSYSAAATNLTLAPWPRNLIILLP